MITPLAFRVTSTERDTSLYLASYGVEELAAAYPELDKESLILDKYELGALEQDRLPKIVSHIQKAEHLVDWGLYDGGISPADFVGTVELSKVNYGDADNPHYIEEMQEMGTLIWRSDRRGKGIGTMAKLAVLTWAFEGGKTCVVQAMTSEHNEPAQRGLAKVGFTKISASDYYTYPQGEQTQHWMLVRPDAMDAVATNSEQESALKEGWQRYQTQAQKLSITEVNR